jgi:predicted RNA binding protein YcfA (HicA-like mRNA interferase family)
MAVKFKEVVKLIEEAGWYQIRQKGSHRQFKHDTKIGLVTIAYHSLNDTVPVGTLNSIYKQAQIER